MRKILAILLCLTIALSLFACGTATPASTSSSSLNDTGSSTIGSATTGSSTIDSVTTGSSTIDSVTTGSSTIDSVTTGSSTIDSVTTGSSTIDSATTGSSTIDSATTGSSTTDSSTTGSGTTDRPVIIVPDRTSYKATTVGEGDKAAIYYINELVKHPNLTPYYNGYKSALTMTFDDGYDAGTGTIVSDQFEIYGFRGTMMLGPCFLGGEGIIEEWNNVFSRGFLDVGCHGYNHKEPTTLDPSEYEHEIKDAIEFLRDKFPTQRVLTFATPYAHINDSYEEYLSQYVIGNRLESGGSLVNLGTNLNFNTYRVMAVSVNKGVNLATVHSAVKTGIESGNWMVELFHCVLPEASNNTDISQDVFEYHCEYLYRNYRDDVWFATFEEVLVYAEELRHTAIKYTDCDRETMTFTVTPDGTLDTELYNIPLSAQIYLPSFVDSAYAMVNGEYQPLDLVIDYTTGYRYVIVRDLSATEESEIVVYIGANKTMKNNCIHSYYVDEIVEPTHDSFGYTVNMCAKCEHTYNSAFTNPVHNYIGTEVEVIAPTEAENGLSKHYCIQCDKYEIRETEYSDVTE